MSCHGLVKTLLFFVNFIFSLIGIGIFIVGVLGVVYINQINNLYPDTVPSFLPPTVMIIGTVVFFISFSGCCGAIKEINCLLVLYTVVMLLLAVAKIAIAIYILINKDGLEKYLSDIVNNTHIADAPKEFHALEYMASCCGTTGPSSYINANVTVPATCCPVLLSGTPDPCVFGKEDIYEQGCQEFVSSHKLASILNIASYTFIGIAVFELLSMISAIYLTCTSRKANGYYEYD